MKKGFVLVAAALVSVAQPASAVLIDFTSDLWAGAGGLSYTQAIDDLGVTLLTFGNLAWTAQDPADSAGPLAGLAGDGVGIGVNDGKVSPGELLGVFFSKPVEINSVYFLDLFVGEVAAFWIRGGRPITMVSPTERLGGLVDISIGTTDPTWGVFFWAPGDSGYSDYAVAGIDVTVPVPEPGTIVLLGAGLVGLAAYGRKRLNNRVS